MPPCPHGHEVVDGQRFCGECGAEMVLTCRNGHSVGASNDFCPDCGEPLTPPVAEASELADDMTASPASAEAEEAPDDVYEPPTITPSGSLARLLGRMDASLWITLVLGAGVVLLIVVLAVSSGNDGEDEASRTTGTTSPPITVDPSPDNCFQDLAGILEAATATGSTYDSATTEIATTYGMTDERTRFLLETLGQFQGDTFQVGAATANDNVDEALITWCATNAERFGY